MDAFSQCSSFNDSEQFVSEVEESFPYNKYLTELQIIYNIPKSIFLKQTNCREAVQLDVTEEKEDYDEFVRYFYLKCYPNGDCKENEGFVSLIFEENPDEIFEELHTLNVTFALVDAGQNRRFPQSFTLDHKERLIPVNETMPILRFGLSRYMKREILLSSDIFCTEKLFVQCDIQCCTLENVLEEVDLPPFILEDTVSEEGYHTSIIIQTAHPVWNFISERSPFFNKLLIKDGASKISLFDEDQCRSFDILLRCMMSGTDPSRQDLSLEEVCNLYEFADYVLMPDFKQRCGIILKQRMTSKMACNVIVMADMNCDTDLKNFAIQIATENYKEVVASKSYRVFCEKRPDLAREIEDCKETVVGPPKKRKKILEADDEYAESFPFYQ